MSPWTHAISAVRTLDWYAGIRQRVEIPVLVTGRLGAGRITVLGVEHSHDVHHRTMEMVRQAFRRVRPTIAFVEGGYPTRKDTVELTIGAHGEAGLLSWLAHASDVPLHTLEPWRIDEARQLWPCSTRTRVKLFYLLRDLVTWHRGDQRVPIEEHARVLLDNLSRAGVAGAPRQVDDVPRVVATELPDLLDWRAAPADWFDPCLSGRWTQALARASSHVRDRTMLARILRQAHGGHRVLAVMGYSHAVVQAPAYAACLTGARLRGVPGWTDAD